MLKVENFDGNSTRFLLEWESMEHSSDIFCNIYTFPEQNTWTRLNSFKNRLWRALKRQLLKNDNVFGLRLV